MTRLSRRYFLQGAGATLAALGWSQLDWQRQGDLYGRALAQSTPRKLALLVGINEYPSDGLFAPLNGCVNDVELQYHLLVHRFGFNPSDIVKLTDAQATRQGILTAFEEHLIGQARPGDVVVFHFSGHGSRVVDPDQDFPDGLNSTLVPVDSPLPAGFPRQGGPVNDITGHTLFLLGSALQTDNVTMVLDSCHSGGGTRGNLVVRARRGGPSLEMSPAELAYQNQWLSRLNMAPADFIKQRREGIARGVAIASARREQYAADAPFEDFYAGAFSYVMTQYLWQQTGTTPFGNTVPNIARTTTQLSFSAQEPPLEVQPGSSYGSHPIYFSDKIAPPAEAVVTKVEGSTAEIWLGGIDPRSLEAFQTDAILSAVDDDGEARGLLQITSRQGLTGQGRLLETAKPTGALLQEQVRGVPSNVSLRIGLDTSLTAAEQEQARQGITAIPRMEALPLQQGEVHYLLGRMTAEYRAELVEQADIPSEGSLGLFAPGLDLIPGSFSQPGESVERAIQRLRPKLRSLLAARLVKLTLNPGSSRLALQVTMAPIGGTQVVASAFTVRGTATTPPPRSGIQQIALGTSIQFEIQNQENRDLYLSVLVIDATGEMAVIFPNQWTAATEVTRIGAGQTLRLPDPSRDSFRLVTQAPTGPTEVLVVASSQPLDNALRALQAVATRSGTASGPVAVADPTDVVSGLLTDVSDTRGSGSRAVQSVDASQLAALSVTFDVF
ncbi:MAG: caspase family protein [Leptolyngbyaceae cyanobacterium]